MPKTSNGVKSLLSYIVSAGFGLWLASMLIVGVSVTPYPDSNFFGISLASQWQLFVFFGIVLGLLNYFVKPILNIITLPLRIITLGLFGFVVNMALLWIVDAMFRELSTPLLYPLVWTTLIIWTLNFFITSFVLHKE